jgi:release factor glutamine methyltransferase
MTAEPVQRTYATEQARLAVAFAAAGLDSPQADARLLLAHALGIERLALVAMPNAVVSAEHIVRIDGYLKRRLAHEPVSRIIGERWFYGRSFKVTPATLDPRPDSETLIEAVLTLLAEDGVLERPLRILDIGTGTGCLLLTLLAELPFATGVGSDISDAALAVAKENAQRLGVAARCSFAQGADFEPISGAFDLVVSNPPYIPTDDVSLLDPEVCRYDPMTALDGGSDGLTIYRRLSKTWKRYILGGWIVFEVGRGQSDQVASMLKADAPDISIRTFKDLAGLERCVAGKSRAASPY